MERSGALVFKVATEKSEFEAIHRLNYRRFIEENDRWRAEQEGSRGPRPSP